MSKTQSAIAKLVTALLAGGLLVAMAAVLMLNAVPVKAWNETPPPCKDFMTGGGFITPSNNGAHANFGMGGSCKPGGDAHGLWGHLEYVDHGSGISSSPTVPVPFNVHWLTITGYFQDFVGGVPDGGRPHQPTGARIICGTARTNDPSHPNVNFAVRGNDQGEPGTSDQFDIALQDGTGVFYATAPCGPSCFHTLAGGNIQLHAGGNINGTFGPEGGCPALGR